MSKIQVNLFSENEYDFYQYRIRYHVEQYIPELFPKKSGDELGKHIGNIGKIAGVVKRIGDIGTLDSSGALIMAAGVKRPDETSKRKAQYEGLNNPSRSDEVRDNTCSLEDIANGTEKQLMQFVNFALQTDVPMKPLGYIFLRKLEQYSFWKTWEGIDEISPSDFEDVLTRWSAFKQYRVDWISTQRKESLDGFAQENIFRCLNLIYQGRTAKIGDREYIPVRVWIDNVGWLYRRKIPYLVARPVNNLGEFELFRLDQHVFVEKGNKFKNASVSWVDEQEIREGLGASENKNISGIYFYHKDLYIGGKLELDSRDFKNAEGMELPTITFPYHTLTDGEIIKKVRFEKNALSISEVERKLLMRSCGEFVQFDDAPTNKWDSAKEWEESNPSLPACTGSLDKAIGLINPKYTSFDAIGAPFSCIQLATVSNSPNNRYEEEWESLKCISSEYVTEWRITDTELDWLYAVLTDNAELASQFGVSDELASKINEKLGNMKKVFRPSKYCETQTYESSDISVEEAKWNQNFHMLSSDNALTNEVMQKAMQCVRDHKLLSYQFDEEGNQNWVKCLIYPYRFQIKKERKIQLLAYDLKKFKLLTINDFGPSRYEDIRCVAPSELSEPAKLSKPAKQFLLCAAYTAPEDNRDNEEKLLAAREIVYYYRLLVGEPEENPYTGNGYDCDKLRTMLGRLKEKCESVKDQSVFKKVQVNGKELSVCSRMIMGGNLWGNIKQESGIKNWTIAWWLRQYEKKLDGTTIQVSKPKKISSTTFNNKYTSVMKKQKWSTPILSAAFGYYKTYIEATYPDKQYMWNNDVYHSDKELRHIYKILHKISKCDQIENVTVADNDLIKYIQAEIKNLNDAKQCTALLGICGELSMAKLDLIYHIFNEFDLTTEAVVCDPNDYDSENANEFKIVRCIRVKYPSYAFRKLHEGILALQDFVYPLAPNDLKNIIRTREKNMNTIYNWGGTTDE